MDFIIEEILKDIPIDIRNFLSEKENILNVYDIPFIEINPIAQQRPGKRKKVGNSKREFFDPERSKKFKQDVRFLLNYYLPKTPSKNPMICCIWFFFKKESKEDEKRTFKITKPDTKNLFAGVEDALRSGIYKDDSQNIIIVSGKFYGEKPGIKIKIIELKTNK